MDLHSMPGVVHVALEVPERSHVLRLCLPECVPHSYDHLAVARGKGYCHLPKAPGIRTSTLDDGGCRPGLCSIDREFDPLNRSSLAGYCIALIRVGPASTVSPSCGVVMTALSIRSSTVFPRLQSTVFAVISAGKIL